MTHYVLKPDALTSNTYFNFDTTNSILTDKFPRPSFPYLESKMFAVSPLKKYTKFGSVTFRIDPAFIFKDAFNGWTRSTLQIDFGDGNGWITINNTAIVSNYTVIYTQEGEKKLEIRLIDNSTSQLQANSAARLVVPVTQQIKQPDQVWTNIPGMSVGVYMPCVGSNPLKRVEKVVIYLEGIDMLENRGLSEIYRDMIVRSDMAQLQNFGYTFMIVNWNNSRKDIKENAVHFTHLIKYLRAILNNNGSQQPFVVVGESMGGLVARYGLCLMEQMAVSNPTEGHNTRLLITIDTPHQGANIPLSVQTFYRDATDVLSLALYNIPGFLFWRYYARTQNILLDSKAAKQMLIYHVDTRNYFPNPFHPTFKEDRERNAFLADLAAIGNYPQFCKKIALSNGSLTGTNQNRYKYDEALRQPNDFLLDFNANVYVRILSIRLRLTELDLELNTNPEGKGQLVRIGLSSFVPRIRLFWFGVRITLSNSLFSYERHADTKGICANAGGYYSTEISPSAQGFGAGFDAFICSVRSTNNGNGLYEFDFNVGVPWLANAGVNFSIYSDGFHWCFIPTQSALDYTDDVNPQGIPLSSYNIWQDPINEKLQRTPFDVIIGIPDEGGCVGGDFKKHRGNMQHLYVRNEDLPQGSLRTCNGSPDTEWIRARLLNREIGDEQLWLGNYTMTQTAHLEAEFDIFVNRRFPFYQYEDTTPVNDDLLSGGLYSKSAPFLIQTPSNQPIPRFRFENSLNYQAPFSGTYQVLQQPVDICCLNYGNPNQFFAKPSSIDTQKKEQSISIYPNPIFDGILKIKCSPIKEGEEIKVKLTDLQGRERLRLSKSTSKEEIDIDLNVYALEKGMYMVSITTSTQHLVQKIIIY